MQSSAFECGLRLCGFCTCISPPPVPGGHVQLLSGFLCVFPEFCEAEVANHLSSFPFWCVRDSFCPLHGRPFSFHLQPQVLPAPELPFLLPVRVLLKWGKASHKSRPPYSSVPISPFPRIFLSGPFFRPSRLPPPPPSPTCRIWLSSRRVPHILRPTLPRL